MASPTADPAIRALHELDELRHAARVIGAVWGGDEPLDAPFLSALAHSGGYVVGLYDDVEMVGASVAWFGPPAERSLHSHITGILPGRQGQGLGRAVKEHQRAWALERGVTHITWSFDPLIARNAHFNLAVLGARATEYVENMYGPMDDARNRGDESDRLLASWSIDASAPPPAPIDPVDIVATIGVPNDIETLRRTSPIAARAWRLRVREQFAKRLGEGLVVGGFSPEWGYLLVRP